MATPSRLLWQVAGVFALAHVALIPVGIYLQGSPLFADGTAGITESYVEGDITRSFTGGVLESFGFLLMVPALVFLGAEAHWEKALQGAIILAAVAGDALQLRRRRHVQHIAD